MAGSVFVISDLHLGGAPAVGGTAHAVQAWDDSNRGEVEIIDPRE